MLNSVRIVKRHSPGLLGTLVTTAVALASAFATSALMLLAVGVDAIAAFHALLLGAFGSWSSLSGTLLKAVPLAFAGLATGIAFRARIWNIGQEGQLFAGAMMGYLISSTLSLPPLLFVPAVIVAGFVGGAILGAFSGFLKAIFHVDEIVSTVMMNYIVLLVLSYLLTSGLWMAPGEYYLQTAQVPEAARFPSVVLGLRLNLSFLLVIIAIVAVHLLLSRTTFGYAVRAFGSNPDAARFRGTDPKRMYVLVLLISGGLAGLGGVSQTFGVDFRVNQVFLIGLGSTGIIVGVIAGLRPIAIGLAAILFGAMSQGGLFMQVMVGVSSAIVLSMQAIVLIFFLFFSVLSRYRLTLAPQHV